MKLADLLKFNQIVIQCHDNPDADAIASGYGLYTFFLSKGKDVRLIYGGQYTIQKSNLILMKDLLEIPIEKVDKLDPPELLITVDCQYGEGNVTSFEAQNVAVIDHHQVSQQLPVLSDVRSNLGACSTLIWNMLEEAGFDGNEDWMLATAMYYGLYTDTNGFAELSHPLDRDLRDEAQYNKVLIRKFLNANLSIEELTIAGEALLGYEYEQKHRFAVVKAAPCDPNILGMISDLMLEVDTVDTCLVYSELPFGVKISVRSCIKETKASDLANFLVRDVGSGGGHVDKAGGFIQKELLGDVDVKDFFMERMNEYFDIHEVIYASEHEIDLSQMKEYRKLPISVGYVKTTDLAPVDTLINIRTLEGDVEIKVDEDVYITIGIEGEVYPTNIAKFNKSYDATDTPFVYEGDYAPTVKDVKEGRGMSLLGKAKFATATGGVHIFAAPLTHPVKIFTEWDQDRYMSGQVGDYLACRSDDYHDIYVIAGNIFEKTYEEVDG